MPPFKILSISIALQIGTCRAEPPTSSAAALAQAAARRFPQPVRVGDLIDHQVLEPVESQAVLGRVARIVRGPDGGIEAVISLGGVFGIGARPITVPVDAMVLLGADMEVVGFNSGELRRFPTFNATDAIPLAPDAVIRIGLAKPSH